MNELEQLREQLARADTRAAILRGDYYERHVKPAAEAENERRVIGGAVDRGAVLALLDEVLG